MKTTQMKPIRILHILHSMNRGGTENAIMNYYRHIDKSKIQFDFLLTCVRKCDFEDEILSLGGRINRVPQPSLFKIKSYSNAVGIFLQSHNEYKIVHSHTSSKSTLPLWIAKRKGVPIRIAHAHSNASEPGFMGFIRNSLKWPLKKIATDFMACGYDAGVWLYGINFMQKGRVHILKNVIECQKFNFNQEVRVQMRKMLGLQEDSIVVGNVARFNVDKNHLFLLDVFAEALKLNPNLHLLLVGDGELRDTIEKKITELRLTQNVILTGVVSNVYDFLQAMDIFLFPSLHEGLGMGLIEAQVAGLTCFTSAITVPKAADITGMVHYLPLSETPISWANYILEHIPLIRKGHIDDARKAGYDAELAASVLQKYYIERFNMA